MEKTILSAASTTTRIQLGARLVGIQFPATLTSTHIAIKPIYGNMTTGQLVYDTAGNLDTDFLIQYVANGYIHLPIDKTIGWQYVEIVSCNAIGTATAEGANRTFKLFLATLK